MWEPIVYLSWDQRVHEYCSHSSKSESTSIAGIFNLGLPSNFYRYSRKFSSWFKSGELGLRRTVIYYLYLVKYIKHLKKKESPSLIIYQKRFKKVQNKENHKDISSLHNQHNNLTNNHNRKVNRLKVMYHPSIRNYYKTWT